MPRIAKNIPLMDLMSYLIETPDTPTSVGTIQVLEPINGSKEEVIERILDGFRRCEVAPPFCYVPVFPRFGLPKWAQWDGFDTDYHVRRVTLPAPGDEQQLLRTVMDLHEPLLSHNHPGWIAYVIDGLEDDLVAIYLKLHHAYIDGASALMRFDAAFSRSPEETKVTPIWTNLFPESDNESGTIAGVDFDALARHLRGLRDVGGALNRSFKQASGVLQRDMPLPFSAPNTLFNRPVHARRRLGAGSVPLERFTRLAKQQSVSVNEVILTIVGDALERYQREQGESADKPLVAICPLSTRDSGDTRASTQIAAISVALGEPGITIEQRLGAVHASSRDAKEDAAQMSSEALMDYLVVLGGISDVLQKSPLGKYMPQSTNVNVSNVAGPTWRTYIGGAEIVRSYPVSTLAGGTAINITFGSGAGRMDFAAITDVKAIPEPQRIADYMIESLDALHEALSPASKSRSGADSSRPATATRKKPRAKPRAAAKSRAKAKAVKKPNARAKTRTKSAASAVKKNPPGARSRTGTPQ